MQTPARVADPLDEDTLHETVDILVVAGDKRRIASGRARGSVSAWFQSGRLRRAAGRRRGRGRAPRRCCRSRLRRTDADRNGRTHRTRTHRGRAPRRIFRTTVLSSDSWRLHRTMPLQFSAYDSSRLTSAAARLPSRATTRIVSSPAMVPTVPASCARSSASASACACPRPVRSTTSCCTRSTWRRNSDDGPLEHRAGQLGARGVEARPLIRAVAGALDEPEVGDVARDRRLRGVESLLVQAAPHLLLAVERLEIDEFQDDRLTSGFHEGHDEDTRSGRQ